VSNNIASIVADYQGRGTGEPPWMPDVHINVVSPARLYQPLDDWFRQAIAAWDIDGWFQREILNSNARPLRITVWCNNEQPEVPKPLIEVRATHAKLREKCVAWLLDKQSALNEIFAPEEIIASPQLLSREETTTLGWDALDWEAAKLT
jgi:hypothetical protein